MVAANSRSFQEITGGLWQTGNSWNQAGRLHRHSEMTSAFIWMEDLGSKKEFASRIAAML